jgi:hypothetical protein
VVLACSLFVLTGLSASADDKKERALSGIWAMKDGELKIEFVDKKSIKIFPHGDSDAIVVLCEYSLEKDGLVKAKITGFEGKDEAKEAVKNILPIDTKFTFKWKVKDDTAKLEDVKGDQADHLKSHLEGDHSQKK